MEPATLADTFGTYRLQQEMTPSQRRALRRWNAAVLAVVTIWVVVQVLRHDTGAAYSILLWIFVGAVVNVTSTLIGRRLGPMTRIDANGISSSTGLTGGRRSARWDEVAYVDEPQRFEDSHAAVLARGGRLELPGLPTSVIERLKDALGHNSPHTGLAPPRPPGARTEADDDWDGPFHRGR